MKTTICSRQARVLTACLAAIIVLAVGVGAGAQEKEHGTYRLKRKGQQWETYHKIEYRASTDEYRCTKLDQLTIITVARSQVEDIDVPRPAQWDALVAALHIASPSDANINKMENIVREKRRLKLDILGSEHLIIAYHNRGKHEDVYKKCAYVKAETGSLAINFAKIYWTSLKETDRLPELKERLDEAIEDENSPRALTAAAYMIRGDMLFDKGKYKEALVNGYLRVVILYEDVRSLREEALYRSWLALKEKHDRRADKMREKLLAEFPRGKYAGKVRDAG